MKTIMYKPIICLMAFICMLTAYQGHSQFTRTFGAPTNESFIKVLQSGSNYYCLGRRLDPADNLQKATVTYMNSQGQISWVEVLPIASEWTDAVVTPSGLLTVGYTLPFNSTTKSLIGSFNAGGFVNAKSYDVTGRDFFNRIIRSPLGGAFPYYIVGGQHDPSNPSATWDDVVLLNVNAAGTISWKRKFNSIADDEFFRDLEVLPNGELVICGSSGNNGVILKVDQNGIAVNAGTPENIIFSYTDISRINNVGYYAVGEASPSFIPYLIKYDNDFLPLWHVSFTGLTDINQVWHDPATGRVFVTGKTFIGGQTRTVLIRLFEAIKGSPAIEWVRYLDKGETAYVDGSYWFLSPNQIAFTDGRIPAAGGFGGYDGFLHINNMELTSCMTKSISLGLQSRAHIYNSPEIISTFVDIPRGVEISSIKVTWQSRDACQIPCNANFNFQNLSACGNIQFTNQSTGAAPLTYAWNFGDPASGNSNTSTSTNPTHQFSICGNYQVCLVITASDGCKDTICKAITYTDIIKPVITCPADITISCNTSTLPSATGTASATDNCMSAGAIGISYSDVSAIKPPCSQIITRTWQATDVCKNTSSCIQIINVVDTTKPTIYCPQDRTVQCNINNPASLGLATATDNCTATSNIVLNHTDALSGTAPCNLTITRTWTAEDLCNNKASCVQIIKMVDTVPPTIVCPSNKTVNTNAGVCYFNGTIPIATTTDSCDANPIITCSLLTATSSILITPNTQFPKGVNTITCFARDVCGNQSKNCNFTLTVVDNEKPKITCPNSMTVLGSWNALGQCKAVVNNIAPIVTDNCPMYNYGYQLSGATVDTGREDASGIQFMSGVTTVTYVVVDMGLNKDTCSFIIKVRCEPTPCDLDTLNKGLVGYFPFLNNANDLSLTSINGSVVGPNLTIGQDNVNNSAYHFNGFGQYINCGSNNRNITKQVSIMAWIKTTERNLGQWVAGKYEFTERKGYGIAIGDNNSNNLGKVAIGGRDGVGNNYYSSGYSYDTVNDGKWHCIVGTVGNGVWSIYIDGNLQSSALGGSVDLTTSSSVPFTIGSYTGTNTLSPLYMDGDIDNVLVYNRVLSQKEIDCLCPGNLPLGNSCICRSFSNLSARLHQGAPNQSINCGDTIPLNCPFVFQFGGEFHCQGQACERDVVDWKLDGPGLDSAGTVFAASFGLPIDANNFATPGFYTLTLVGYCNGLPCPPCKIYFEVKECDTCFCGSFTNLSARINLGQQNLSIDCKKTYLLDCPPVFQFGGDFTCQGNNCDSTTKVEWNINGPISSGGTVLANSGFTLPLNANSFSLPGLYTLTLIGYCDGVPCPPCTIYFEVIACPPPTDTCCNESQNIIANGGFLNQPAGNITTTSLPWYAANLTPQIGTSDSCNTLRTAQMWGNSAVGEVMGQTIPGLFKNGWTYRIEFCAKFININNLPANLRHGWFNLEAENGPYTGNGALIGQSPVLTQHDVWTNVCLPDWTPNANYDGLFINFQNTSTANHGDSVSWGRIDDICIQVVDSGCCADSIAFANLVNQGFTINKTNCKVVVTAPQFDSCYLFSTPPILDGGIVPQVVTDANGMWMYNFTQSGVHQVCVTVFDDCNSKQMCTRFEVKCDTCECGSFSNLSIRTRGAQNQPIQCGKTYPLNCPTLFQFGGDFNCQGDDCDSTTKVEWNINGPIGGGGTVSANSSFTLPLNAQSFSINGLYTLTLIGYCDGKPCPPCIIYFEVTGCKSCCKDSTAFLNTLANFQTNGAVGNCKIFENGTGLDSCMQVIWHWGDGTFTGPVGNATQVSHIYTGTGMYKVCYTIEEVGANGNICHRYTKCDSIYVICDTCECAGADHLSFGGHDFEEEAACNSDKIVDLPCDANGQPFYFHGNLLCAGDSCLEGKFEWEIRDSSGGFTTSGFGPIHIINVNTGHFDVVGLNAALFTPGEIYTITITWYCGGKKCTCDVKFRFKDCDCKCGEFTNVFLRPVPGAASIPVSCNGDAPIVKCPTPGKPFNTSGQFHCVGNECPTNTQIDWMLLDPFGAKVDSGSFNSTPNWNLNLNNHHFGKVGTYTLMLTGHCGSKLCTCKIKFTFKEVCPCDDCNCGKYSKLTIKPGNGTIKSVACGDTASFNCPGNGLNILYSGQMVCEGDSCPKTTTLDWILISPIGNTIASGNGVIVNPNFTISVSSVIMTSSGVYTLQLIGNCGMQRCTCEIKIKMDKPCPDKCECDGYTIWSAVSRGPILNYNCGDSLYVPAGMKFFFAAQLNCKGICPPTPLITMLLIDPNGNAVPVTNIDENTFSIPGTYTLELTGYCGNKVCKCKIYFIKSNDCCKDKEIFEQTVLSAIQVTTDPTKCKATVTIGALPPCDYIEKINWGDGSSSVGPFVSGDMPMHTYTTGGSYSISIIGVEEDPNMGMYCFVKLIKEKIEIRCGVLIGLDSNPQKVSKSTVHSTIKIYPNPTTDILNLELPVIAENSTRVRIINLAGKKLYDQLAQQGSKQQILQVGFLPSGLYFVQIVMPDKKMITEKFVKQ